jgi:hypothetical protein
MIIGLVYKRPIAGRRGTAFAKIFTFIIILIIIGRYRWQYWQSQLLTSSEEFLSAFFLHDSRSLCVLWLCIVIKMENVSVNSVLQTTYLFWQTNVIYRWRRHEGTKETVCKVWNGAFRLRTRGKNGTVAVHFSGLRMQTECVYNTNNSIYEDFSLVVSTFAYRRTAPFYF